MQVPAAKIRILPHRPRPVVEIDEQSGDTNIKLLFQYDQETCLASAAEGRNSWLKREIGSTSWIAFISSALSWQTCDQQNSPEKPRSTPGQESLLFYPAGICIQDHERFSLEKKQILSHKAHDTRTGKIADPCCCAAQNKSRDKAVWIQGISRLSHSALRPFSYFPSSSQPRKPTRPASRPDQRTLRGFPRRLRSQLRRSLKHRMCQYCNQLELIEEMR